MANRAHVVRAGDDADLDPWHHTGQAFDPGAGVPIGFPDHCKHRDGAGA
jgi:hypothetical protein